MLKILLVDDDPELCGLWEGILQKHGGGRLSVETFTDADAALRRFGPDVGLLLLDWHLPGRDGKELLAAARQKGIAAQRIIIFSGSSSRDLHENFPMGDCLAVLNKGDTTQRAILLKIVDEALQGG